MGIAAGTTEVDLIQRDGLSIIERATALLVVDQESFELAGQIRQAGARFRKRVIEFCRPTIAAGLAAHRTALAQQEKLLEPYEEVETILEPRVVTYEQARQEIARRAREAAEKERQRLEEEARLEAALKAEAEGDTKEAERVLDSPVAPIVFTPPVAPAVPKVEGTSFRDHWSAEVIDLYALAEAVVKRTVPVDTIQGNQKMLDRMARDPNAGKENFLVPGVRAVKTRLSPVRG